jgi:hypothetical protein
MSDYVLVHNTLIQPKALSVSNSEDQLFPQFVFAAVLRNQQVIEASVSRRESKKSIHSYKSYVSESGPCLEMMNFRSLRPPTGDLSLPETNMRNCFCCSKVRLWMISQNCLRINHD